MRLNSIIDPMGLLPSDIHQWILVRKDIFANEKLFKPIKWRQLLIIFRILINLLIQNCETDPKVCKNQIFPYENSLYFR